MPSIAEMVGLNLSNFRIIPDRLHQGMVNSLSLMRLMKVNVVCLLVYVLLFLFVYFSPVVVSLIKGSVACCKS